MGDESKSQNDVNDTLNDPQDTNGGVHQDDRQRIFEERFSTLMNGFGEACESENVEVAVAIAVHPDENEPVVFVRGSELDTARLLAYVLRSMKEKIDLELDTNPRSHQ